MITAVEPPPFGKRAFALSIALHCCGLALLASLLPAAQAAIGGRGMRDLAERCAGPCSQVFALRIERRARAAPAPAVRRRAASAPAARPVAVPPGERRPARLVRLHTRDHGASAPVEPLGARAAVPMTSGRTRASAIEVTLAVAPTEASVATRAQPNLIAANPSSGVETASDAQADRGQLGPGNYGSHYDTPTLRDRALYDELLAKLGKRGAVTIAVDDQGRAREVRIVAPGLDPASLEELRKRLLAASYVPVERDGIAFDGTLRIAASP